MPANAPDTPPAVCFQLEVIQQLTEELRALKEEVLKDVIAKKQTANLLDDLLWRLRA